MVPYAKTGGLGDVAGALPDALLEAGAQVRAFVPYYRTIRERFKRFHRVISGLPVSLGKTKVKVHVLECRSESGLPVYAVQREDMFDRPNLYGSGGEDYYDNLERFSVFCHAVLSAAMAMEYHPDIIHCHDWQTGLIPALLQGPYAGRGLLGDAATVFTIHNLGYQGIFPKEKIPLTGLDATEFLRVEGIEYWGSISLLKAGIVYSDAVTTVSPTYAKEITTPELGMGMEGVLKKRASSLYGILNGGDYARWAPESDPFIPYPYGLNEIEGKAKCKAALVHEMGLDAALLTRPILGIISRLDNQKGLDLVLKALDPIMALDVGLVVLGTGSKAIEEDLLNSQKRYHGRMAVSLAFDDPLAHRIMAGADIFLVPSRYEPCGLTQMYALKYGTVPVVRATGGLEDTIREYHPLTGGGNGFKFAEPEPDDLYHAVKEAVVLYEEPTEWQHLRKTGMEADCSWKNSARKYMEVFRWAIAAHHSGPGIAV